MLRLAEERDIEVLRLAEERDIEVLRLAALLLVAENERLHRRLLDLTRSRVLPSVSGSTSASCPTVILRDEKL